jgi:hypothetical protein
MTGTERDQQRKLGFRVVRARNTALCDGALGEIDGDKPVLAAADCESLRGSSSAGCCRRVEKPQRGKPTEIVIA